MMAQRGTQMTGMTKQQQLGFLLGAGGVTAGSCCAWCAQPTLVALPCSS
jgi:hypothetical protein